MWESDALSSLDYQLIEKWKIIAADLNIDVISPYEISTSKGNYVYAVFIKDFGQSGTNGGYLMRAAPELFDPEHSGPIAEAANERMHAYAEISPQAIEALNAEEAKWTYLEYYEYHGEDQKRPEWYTGKNIENSAIKHT